MESVSGGQNNVRSRNSTAHFLDPPVGCVARTGWLAKVRVAEEPVRSQPQRLHQVFRQSEKRLLLCRCGVTTCVTWPREITDQHDADGACVLPFAVPDHVGQFVALVDGPIIVKHPVVADVGAAASRDVIAGTDVVVVDPIDVAVAGRVRMAEALVEDHAVDPFQVALLRPARTTRIPRQALNEPDDVHRSHHALFRSTTATRISFSRSWTCSLSARYAQHSP